MRKPWWDGSYSGQSLGGLIQLAETYELESLLFPIEMAVDNKRQRIGLDHLTEEEWIILAVEGLEREVNNGGYSQFFTNSTGEFAPKIVECLQRIGCPKVAVLTQKAIDTLGVSSLDTDSLNEAVAKDGIGELLDECDQEYYSTGEHIGGKLFEFIRANAAAILE